jgi:DNA-directed RNA polymerase subunit RPC12/RpoP
MPSNPFRHARAYPMLSADAALRRMRSDLATALDRDCWRCPDCGSRTYARVDERKPTGKFGPGPLIRCVDCKREYDLPEASSDV